MLVLIWNTSNCTVQVMDAKTRKVTCKYSGMVTRDQVEDLADQLATDDIDVEIVEV